MVGQVNTAKLLNQLHPPAYGRREIPVSTWSIWFTIASALLSYGNTVIAGFGPDIVEQARDVAERRLNWETEEAALTRSARHSVAAVLAHKEAAAIDATGTLPVYRSRLNRVLGALQVGRRLM